MDEVVRRIKERVDLVEVVSRYVKLTKAGKSYKGLSPFKKEKTPSFFVSPDKQLYYCFASGKGGDVFTFIQEVERVDFRGALEILAKEAGVELKPVSPKEASRKERWYAALEAAAEWFSRNLKQNPEARQYLARRGVDERAASVFRLGYAPSDPAALLAHLTDEGFTKEELLATGIAKQRDDGSYVAQLRSRIVFPLCDTAGRVVGFSGRRFPEDERLGPKYLNTPETALFKKGETLYPWHLAKEPVRRHDCAIVVEGQMDVVNAHRAGWPIAVAVSGTGFTEHHAALLTRAARRIIFALDADEAGFRSLARSAALVLGRGAEVRVAVLPEGKDPADVISQDPEAWRESVRAAQPVVAYVARRLLAGSPQEKARGMRDYLVPLIGAIPSAVARSLAAQEASAILDIPASALLEDTALWRAQEARGARDLARATEEERVPASERDYRTARERFVVEVLRYGSEAARRRVEEVVPQDMREALLSRYPEDETARIAIGIREEEDENFASLAQDAAYEVVWLATKDAFAAAARSLEEMERQDASHEQTAPLLRELDALRDRLRQIEDAWRVLRG
ncbi:MAG: hypothetical protein KatS3mg099_298 [Candidatus Parcubacteria bacterium]|nr:MAG: hypothetical protein KatS3mg099_298 [Candidatus Parcubacteria bacterium]